MRSLLVIACLLMAACGPAQARTLVRYERSGGIAGAHHRVNVSTHGAVRADGRRSTLSRRELRSLRRTVRAARLGSLRATYAPRLEVADGITEVVRHAGRTVTVKTGGHPPERLQRLLGRMAQLVSPP